MKFNILTMENGNKFVQYFLENLERSFNNEA